MGNVDQDAKTQQAVIGTSFSWTRPKKLFLSPPKQGAERSAPAACLAAACCGSSALCVLQCRSSASPVPQNMAGLHTAPPATNPRMIFMHDIVPVCLLLVSRFAKPSELYLLQA